MKKINKTEKNKMKHRVKKVMTTLCILCSFYMMYGMTAMAVAPKLVTGTKKLAEDGAKWLTLLIVGLTTVIALFKGFKWQASDEQGKSAAAKEVKNTILIGAVLTCISGLITLILSYYK